MLALVFTISIVGIWSLHRVGKGADIILRESSHLNVIQELRLSFEKILMPSHDYLILGNKKEAQDFENLLKILKKDMVIKQNGKLYINNVHARKKDKNKSLNLPLESKKNKRKK